MNKYKTWIVVPEIPISKEKKWRGQFLISASNTVDAERKALAKAAREGFTIKQMVEA